MLSLTFHGGVNEIGGNKILLVDGGTKIFLDFGMSFKTANTYFAEFLNPRKCNGILDFVEFGLLPEINGIYRNDFLKHSGFKESPVPSVDAVLLTHAHLDHAAYISHLHHAIPVYCGTATRQILKAMQDTGPGSFNDYVVYHENFGLRQKKRGEGLTKLKGEEATRNRDIRTFRNRDTIHIGDIVVTPVTVDHSIPGAFGFIIETSEGNIVYTGDLRFHGYRSNLTAEFVRLARVAEPKALICEGTNITEERGIGEEEVKMQINTIVSNTRGIVIANFPPRDTDRMRTFYDAACENDRKLVINLKQAYMLKLLEEEALAPSITDENILIYVPRKNWGSITKSAFPEEIVMQDYLSWERDFIHHRNRVTCEDVRYAQEELIFFCDFFSMKELIDIRPDDKSCFIWSRCEPFTEDMVLERKRVDEWLKHFHLYPMNEVHASGHAYRHELKRMVNEINPDTLYPVHTEHAEQFNDFFPHVEIVNTGKKYSVGF
jgi:ribonuclease J